MSKGTKVIYTDLHGVVKAWADGLPARGGSSLHTDGETLYSYALPIGVTVGKFKLVGDYRGAFAYSRTTSRHVSLAVARANEVYSPLDFTPLVKSMGLR